MGKGGSATTEQTTTQDVPEWAKPYYTDILGKSKSLSEEAYVPFTGQRIAGDSGDLSSSQDMIRNAAAQGGQGFDAASGTLGGLGSLAGSMDLTLALPTHPRRFLSLAGLRSSAALRSSGLTPRVSSTAPRLRSICRLTWTPL
jgi:hypothetical protein